MDTSPEALPAARGAAADSQPDPVNATDRARWLKGGLMLQEAVAAAAEFADSAFAIAHAAALRQLSPEELSGAANPTCPSLFAPQAAKPCRRDSHSAASHPGCDKCKLSGPSEPQHAISEQFAALHLNYPSGKLMWSNSDARQWATEGSHVQMAKLYCGSLGRTHEIASAKSTFAELDATALFNMMSWCTIFPPELTGQAGLAQKAVAARNLCFHEGATHLSLTEEELARMLENLTALLVSIRDHSLGHEQRCSAALNQSPFIMHPSLLTVRLSLSPSPLTLT